MTLPLQNFIDQQTVVTAAWLNAIDAMYHGAVPAQGTYEAPFNFGSVQLAGPNNLQMAFGDFGFGLTLPAPDGSSIPGLLVGGAGKVAAQIITDEQIPGQNGINLYIVAGETAVGDTHAGGKLWLFGGAADNGPGGDTQVQGGTSVNQPGGNLILQGGNSTNGAAGDVFVLGGVTGAEGGSVYLICTVINNSIGNGVVIRANSTVLWTFSQTGAIFPGDGSTGAGNVGDALLSRGANAAPFWGTPGTTGGIILSLSGATASTPQGAFAYQSTGRQVTIWTDTALAAVPTGPNSIILSTLPTNLRPGTARSVPCVPVINGGGSGYLGQAVIDTNGGITISPFINAANGPLAVPDSFSTASSKGIDAGWSITYSL